MLTCAIESQMEHGDVIMAIDCRRGDRKVLESWVPISLTVIDSLSTSYIIFPMNRSSSGATIPFKAQALLLRVCHL